MADIPLHGAGAPQVGQTLGTAANWAGAVVSLALLAGVGVWGYQLLMRDVSGVPVVRALEGPMRVAPEDPGGLAADHQGLAVNQVAGQGEAQPAADRLLLAPAQAGVTEEDTPGAVLPQRTALTDPTVGREEIVAEIDPIVAEPVAPAAPAQAEDTIAAPATPTAPAATGGANATILALADQIAAGVDPLSNAGPADTPEVKTEIVAAPQPEAKPAAIAAVSTKGAVARSLRPQLRPAGLRAGPASAPLAAIQEVAASSGEVDAARIPAGTRLVQLGAFDSAEVARSEWERLSSKFSDYLDGKERVIQRATSGGRVFYRLRAMGFADLNDARRFCSALTAQRADCIPVVTR